MITLNEFNYNKNEWEIVDWTDYLIKNLATNRTYSIMNGLYYAVGSRNINVRGIQQISSYEFVLHCVLSNVLHYVCKFCLSNGDIKQIFLFSCRKFFLLTDTTILFDNRFVYDIKQNKKVAPFNWLSLQSLKVIEKESQSVILVEFPVTIDTKPSFESIYIYVDVVNFTVIKNTAYSTLQKKWISLDSQTVEDVIEQDHVSLLKYRETSRSKTISSLQSFEQKLFH